MWDRIELVTDDREVFCEQLEAAAGERVVALVGVAASVDEDVRTELQWEPVVQLTREQHAALGLRVRELGAQASTAWQ